MKKMSYDFIRYQLVPPLFISFFTPIAVVLSLWGQYKLSVQQIKYEILDFKKWEFSLFLVVVYFTWAYICLRMSTKETRGPPDPSGYTPVYKDNGVAYYAWTMLYLIAMEVWRPGFCGKIYKASPHIIGSSNVLALILCTYIYLTNPPSPYPSTYNFYSGVRLHPRLLGVDLKQLINSRIGVMSWQLLVAVYWYHGLTQNGFNLGTFVNFILQTIYLFGFFVWEAGYYHTLDITLDRAGFYLCWGCLVWVPVLYTFSTYALVSDPSPLSPSSSLAILFLGLLFLALKFLVDFEKLVFREKGKLLFGRTAKEIKASYTNLQGKKKTARLITNGFWGSARHLNYTFELLSALAWSAPGFGTSQKPFLYFYFLFILLVHRLFRDEDKCSTKYGEKWKDYCSAVPYRLIPFVF